jgi:hypothetical protein
MSDVKKITESRKADRVRASLEWAGVEELRNIADALEGIRQDLTQIVQTMPKPPKPVP